ncbi:MAG: alanine racemase [Candidatus Zixiibacteriota bacterium]|nr:MAG: alanine racemase [candidate division Zixibacteria bacterium]
MKCPAPLVWIELSRSALKRNLDSLIELAGGRQMAVCVKANAYGHGLPQIVCLLAGREEIDYLSVHSLQEAIDCREAGWTRKILVLGPIPSDCLDAVISYDLEPVIFELHTLRRLGAMADKARREIRTHLKLETGTNRQGITEKELPRFSAAFKKYRFLGRPFGVSTHFANIEDTTQHDYAQSQLTQFRKMVTRLDHLGIRPKIRHTAASAALILFEKTHFDLVRPGIAAYGHWPSKETYLSYRLQGGKNGIFRPVLTWKARITQLKDLPTDSFIGYGCTYRTTSPTRLAVLPVGYFDGFDRKLSNQAYVLIGGRRAPVRGRVCMNLTMVDVTDVKGVKVGDEAVLIGRQGHEILAAEQLAGWAGTINYEMLARLSSDIHRRLVR